MDLFEYQGKQLFARYGIPVSAGEAVTTVEDAVAAADRLGYPVVVKAQVLVGGRGKAGGVKVAADAAEARWRVGPKPASSSGNSDARLACTNARAWFTRAAAAAKAHNLLAIAKPADPARGYLQRKLMASTATMFQAPAADVARVLFYIFLVIFLVLLAFGRQTHQVARRRQRAQARARIGPSAARLHGLVAQQEVGERDAVRERLSRARRRESHEVAAAQRVAAL